MGNARTSQRRRHDVLTSPSSSFLPPIRPSASHPSSPLIPRDQSASPEHAKGFGHSFERMAVHHPDPGVIVGNEAEHITIGETTNSFTSPLASDRGSATEQNQPIQTARAATSTAASSAHTLQRAPAPAGSPDTRPLPANHRTDTKRSGWSLERMAITHNDPSPAQRYATDTSRTQEPSSQGEVLQQKSVEAAAPKKNSTGLPDHLKAGVEGLSGFSLDDVHVHYNSPKPAHVDALAYTQGSEIHVGPGQERHLAHEAWHVVQQKERRVQPTLQMKGVAINDDQGLEREADVMGERAKTAQAGEGVLNRSAKTSGEVQMKSVIQRAVGYEFETGWLVEKEETVPEVRRRPLAKREAVGSATYSDFKLEGDVIGAGEESEIEFVTYPPIPESLEGLIQLQETMNRILELGERFKQHHTEASFRLNAVTNVESDAAYIIKPVDSDLKAGPQVTLGIDLAAIPQFLRDNHQAFPRGNNAHDHLPELKGLLTLISQYLKRGLKRVDPRTGQLEGIGPVYNYPKQIAEPLLARTNFVGLFNLIEPEAKERYQNNPQRWVRDVMDFAGLDISRVNEDLLSRGFIRDVTIRGRYMDLLFNELRPLEFEINNLTADNTHIWDFRKKRRLSDLRQGQEQLTRDMERMVSHGHLTVLDWLSEIPLGNDRLPQVNDIGQSPSGFGPRTERVGPGERINAGIFEYRGAQETKIRLEEWRRFALEQFIRIMRIHGHEILDMVL